MLLGVPDSASFAVSPSGRLVAVLATVDASSESVGSPVLAVLNLGSRTMVKAAASSAGQLGFASEATLFNATLRAAAASASSGRSRR